MSACYKAQRGRQISICVQNELGILAKITTMLGKHNINIFALTLTGGLDHGYLRLIVDKTDEAMSVLEQNEYLAFISDVILLEINNEPGALGKVADEWRQRGAGIEYVYCAGGPSVNQGLVVVCVDAIEKALSDAG